MKDIQLMLNGLLQPGNIDYAREQGPVFNPDGSVSTVKSMVFGTDNGSVIAPTVYGGLHHSMDEAKRRYIDTGKHMGVFENDRMALEAEKILHAQEVKRIAEYLKMFPPPGGGWKQPK